MFINFADINTHTRKVLHIKFNQNLSFTWPPPPSNVTLKMNKTEHNMNGETKVSDCLSVLPKLIQISPAVWACYLETEGRLA
jgi:hypothetical protein